MAGSCLLVYGEHRTVPVQPGSAGGGSPTGSGGSGGRKPSSKKVDIYIYIYICVYTDYLYIHPCIKSVILSFGPGLGIF